MIEFWLLDCIIISYDVPKSVSINNEEEFNFVSYRNERGKCSTKKRNFIFQGDSVFFLFDKKLRLDKWFRSF